MRPRATRREHCDPQGISLARSSRVSDPVRAMVGNHARKDHRIVMTHVVEPYQILPVANLRTRSFM